MAEKIIPGVYGQIGDISVGPSKGGLSMIVEGHSHEEPYLMVVPSVPSWITEDNPIAEVEVRSNLDWNVS